MINSSIFFVPLLAAPTLTALFVAGCTNSAPDLGLPKTQDNYPSTLTIVQRVTCELVDMIRDDIPKEFRYKNRDLLLRNDYRVAMLLLLDVTDSGGISPSLNFIYPNFLFDANFTLSQSREDSLSINISYSMRELANRFSYDRDLIQCPDADTALAENLGLKRAVTAALTTPELITTTDVSNGSGEFSGSINFITTKNMTGIGPTWQLTRFRGPGALGSFSEVHNHKLSYGFASGANSGRPFSVPSAVRANRALDRQIQLDFGSQLSATRSLLR